MYWFVYGYDQSKFNGEVIYFEKKDVYMGVKIINSKNQDCRLINNTNGEDWVIIELNKMIEDFRIIKNISISFVENVPIYILGYPNGLPIKYADDASIKGIFKNYFKCNLDAYKGNSGSPVFNLLDNSLLGMLYCGGEDLMEDEKKHCYNFRTYKNSDSFEVVEKVSNIIGALKNER